MRYERVPQESRKNSRHRNLQDSFHICGLASLVALMAVNKCIHFRTE
jgi:hypothetical protein